MAPLVMLVLALAPAATAETAGAPGPLPDAAKLAIMAARFAPVAIGTDLSKLPAGERQAPAKPGEAARIMDPLFPRQTSAGSEALLKQPVGDTTPLGRARLHYFMI